MKKQLETTARTRKVFIDTFCILYRQKPIDKISIQEISKISGYNRSTFYHYFTDIYDLLDYLENDVLGYMKKIAPDGKCTAEPLDVQSLVYLFEEKGHYLEALLGDYGSIRFLERLKNELLTDGIDTRIDIFPIQAYLMEFKITTSTSLFRLWQRRQKDLSSEELIDLIQTLNNVPLSTYQLSIDSQEPRITG